MPIEHNFDNFQKALDTDTEAYKSIVQDPLTEFIGLRFGRRSVNEYMEDQGARFESSHPPRGQSNSGPLRILSSRLSEAVRGGGKDVTGRGNTFEQNTFSETTETGFIWVREIFVPYALIHEKGGRIPITQGTESALWALWYDTGYDAYKYMALAAKTKSYFTIPPRPYIEPALKDIEQVVAEKGAELTAKFINSVLG